MSNLESIIKQLQIIKDKRDISMEHMARELKISLQSVHRILNGKTQYPNSLTEIALLSWIEKNKKFL